MIKKLAFAALLGGTVALSGCAAPYGPGMIFSDMNAPITASSSTSCNKTGESEMTNILGWIATGDASIDSAKKAAGISRVASVDYHFSNILGIIQVTTTKVCGS